MPANFAPRAIALGDVPQTSQKGPEPHTRLSRASHRISRKHTHRPTRRYPTYSTARDPRPAPTCHCQGPAVHAPHGISHRPATRTNQELVTRRRSCTPRDWHELRRSRPLAHATRAAPDQTTSQETRIRPNEPDPVQATPTPGLLAGACCAAHGPRPWDPLERCPTQPRYGGSGQY